MTSRGVWLLVLMALATGLVPVCAWAQGAWAGRVQEELEITERRIELAEAWVPDGAASSAVDELVMARRLQVRARSAFASSRYGFAQRTTLEARTHADRAVVIVRGLPDPDRVQMQLERTAELAERVRERLAECAQPRGKALFGICLEMQSRAEAALEESRYLAALQLTMSARERIFKVMRLCNLAEGPAESAAYALRRTDEVLARAREALGESSPPEDRRSLERAISLQGEAQAKYREEQFESASRLTQAARHTARQVLKAGPPPGPKSGPRRLR